MPRRWGSASQSLNAAAFAAPKSGSGCKLQKARGSKIAYGVAVFIDKLPPLKIRIGAPRSAPWGRRVQTHAVNRIAEEAACASVIAVFPRLGHVRPDFVRISGRRMNVAVDNAVGPAAPHFLRLCLCLLFHCFLNLLNVVGYFANAHKNKLQRRSESFYVRYYIIYPSFRHFLLWGKFTTFIVAPPQSGLFLSSATS